MHPDSTLRRALDIERRRPHAEGFEETLPHHLRVRRTGDLGDHPAQQRVSDVGVLELQPGRAAEGQAARHERVETLDGDGLMPVTPRVIGREASGHREQMGQANRWRRRRQPDARGPRQDLGERRFQCERTLVSKNEDRCSREALGHRRDAKRNVAWRLAIGQRPNACCMDQVATEREAVRDPRYVVLPGRFSNALVNQVHRRCDIHEATVAEPIRRNVSDFP